MYGWLIRLAAYLYDLIISNFLTVTSHILMLDHLKFRDNDRKMLDVGIGTGKPLKSIIGKFPEQLDVVGVDINHGYVEACKKQFADSDTVTVYQKSFYDVEKIGRGPYDIVFFSFSFMLMPQKPEALRLAKSITNRDGRIVFMLTLNQNRNAFFQKLKPLIKKFTTIDFGQVVYENDFVTMLESEGLKVTKKERLKRAVNPLFWIFPIHYVETQKIVH